MRDFMIASIIDNDNNERSKGFADSTLIGIYEQSAEVMELNNEMKSFVAVKNYINLQFEKANWTDSQRKEHDEKENAIAATKGGGGGCCGGSGDLTPETKIAHLLPKLNEVLFEILSEKPFVNTGTLEFEEQKYLFRPEALLNSIHEFMTRFWNLKLAPAYKVSLKVQGGLDVKALRVTDVLKVTVEAERLKFTKKTCNSKFWLCLTNTGSRELQWSHMYHNVETA